MTNTTTNSAGILRPEEVHDLIVLPLTQESVAFQASTVVQTNSHDYRIPTLTGDPDTTWVNEGAEIPVDDADLGEVVVTPRKAAGLTVVSNELAADSSPEATKVIGDRLVQSLRRKVDAAWFATATTNGPAGLGGIAATTVYAGAAFGSLDPFLEAIAAAQNVGAQLTSFVTHPDTALALGKIKKATGSNEPLLQPDPAKPTGRIIAGVPVLVSPDAPNTGVVYGIPAAVTFVVVRKDVEVVADASAFFTSDRVAIRAVARIGFGFPHEDAVVKVLQEVAP